jgi:hypothetical protein
MRRDWIMSDLERDEKRKKIEENRNNKKKSPTFTLSPEQCLKTPNSLEHNIQGYDGNDSTETVNTNEIPFRRRRKRRFNGIVCRDEMMSNESTSFENSPQDSFQSLSPALSPSAPSNANESTIKTTNVETKTEIEIKNSKELHYHHHHHYHHHLGTNSADVSIESSFLETFRTCTADKFKSLELTCEMSNLEKQTLTTILEAYKQAIKITQAQNIQKTSTNEAAKTTLTEMSVRRLTFFFKLITDFRELSNDLMVKLLKKNMMNLIQIQGVNSYDPNENTFKEANTDDTPVSGASIELVYGPDIYKHIMGTFKTLHDLCNGDMTYMKLLLLIILFDPQVESLSLVEKAQIMKIQNKYVNLMFTYLCSQFKENSQKAFLVFKSIIYEVNKVKDLSSWFEATGMPKQGDEFMNSDSLPELLFDVSFPAW